MSTRINALRFQDVVECSPKSLICEDSPKRVQLHLVWGGLQHLWRMPLSRRELEKSLYRMLACSYSGPIELELILVRDGEMAETNRLYMGSHGPTNILSFPLDTPSTPDDPTIRPGSLVFSVDTLHREACLYGQNIVTHCIRLLAHGLGHLYGLDHSPEMDELCAQMEEAALAQSYLI